MNFETMMLRGLFGACVLVCGLALASIVSAKPVPTQLATTTVATATTAG
ncbi:hypothetical protein [Dyella caseinilytica]|uniref:Uncharacterized protein n=1 Tax=Dyella caseinilytica TaxID=1849581 RepID=A0ABX7GT55_9GAMM|nr:hypothetical protein [Dyella caseinilytica]QRN53460.1 hypothetical protein ISN74_18925 [Dyella caseinilytica]GFZ86665.1 hypothetical protein GCM10011408_01430 [Dyella caseinilytica]